MLLKLLLHHTLKHRLLWQSRLLLRKGAHWNGQQDQGCLHSSLLLLLLMLLLLLLGEHA